MTGESLIPNTNSLKKGEARGEGQLLQALVAHWIHEDNLYWTQVRHLLVFQLTVFAAWFALGRTVLSALVMFLSALISLRIYFLADTIRNNRNVNSQAIQVVSKSVASLETERDLQAVLGDDYQKFGLFRYAAHSLKSTTDAGKKFQIQVFGFSIALNVLIGFVTVHDLTCQHAWLDKLHPKFAAQERYDVQPNPALQGTRQSAARP